MIEANFIDGNTCVQTQEIWQYDSGIKLVVRGLEGLNCSTQVHFETKSTGKAIVRSGTLSEGGQALTVNVPAAFLETVEKYQKRAWVYQPDGETGHTIARILIPVAARACPEDYISQSDLSRHDVIEAAVEKYFENNPLTGFENEINKKNVITENSHTGDDVSYPNINAVRNYVTYLLDDLQDYLEGYVDTVIGGIENGSY